MEDPELIARIFFHAEDKITQDPDARSSKTLALFSTLLVKLSWKADKSTREIIRLTRILVVLTVLIAVLTVFLIFQSFFEFPKKRIFFDQEPYNNTQQENQYNQPNQPKHSKPITKN